MAGAYQKGLVGAAQHKPLGFLAREAGLCYAHFTLQSAQA